MEEKKLTPNCILLEWSSLKKKKKTISYANNSFFFYNLSINQELH